MLGILGANIIAFGQPFVAYYWPGGFATPPRASDPWLWAAQAILIDGKMRGLFTLLFGAGLALFADRSAARGASGLLQVRRLAWLFVFGLAHYYLAWRGDILTLYALCGLFALVAVRWSAIQQFALGGMLYLFGAVASAATIGAAYGAGDGDPASGNLAASVASQQTDGAAEIAAAASGLWVDYVAHAVIEHRWQWFDSLLFSFLETVPLMLIGMGMYRAGVFSARFDATRQLRWGSAAVGLGMVLTALVAASAVIGGLSYAATLFAVEGAGAVARIPMVLGLAVLLAAYGARAKGWLGDRLVAAGRMAFSNYLGTSLLMLFVFQAPGLRLFGQFDRPALYGVMLAGWVLMLAWSAPWLARYRYGPLEWLWRCLTYGRWFPLRR